MTLPAIKGRIEGSTASPPPLIDNFGRKINYVRLSLTDKCNLRCLYCMPENMRFMPTDRLLSFQEMERLMRLLAEMGITKVRLTGGEPFIRPGIMPFLHALKDIPGIKDIHITTNGVSTLPFVEELARLGIAGINLSLDTLDRQQFKKITRRDSFDKVMECFHAILRVGIPLKVNMVVMEQWNTDSLLPMAELAEKYPIEMRFIEEMPFNGTATTKATLKWNHRKILSVLQERYPDLHPLPMPPHSTSQQYSAPGHAGKLGIIAGFSRTFCGTCNRIRVTASGGMQTCLYGMETLNFRDLMRNGSSDVEIQEKLQQQIGSRFKDGLQAQKHTSSNQSRSMSLIGG